jgi:hypothetical protein
MLLVALGIAYSINSIKLVRQHFFDALHVDWIYQYGFTKMSFSLSGLFGQNMAGVRLHSFYLASAGFSEPLGSGTVCLYLRHQFSFSRLIYQKSNIMTTKIYVNRLNDLLTSQPAFISF